MDIVQPISVTASTLTVTKRNHAGGIVVINAAAGSTATLPASDGSGARYEFIIGTTVTSNSVIVKVANASDVMAGVAIFSSDNAADATISFETAASSDTITMNGSTTGGIKGDRIILTDVAANLWHVQIVAAATGSEVTPFSATV